LKYLTAVNLLKLHNQWKSYYWNFVFRSGHDHTTNAVKIMKEWK